MLRDGRARSWTASASAGFAIVDETHGFRYFDERDLLGFVDGTENPRDEVAFDAALVADEDPTFAGGSYVIIQKYLHDIRRWNELPIEQQEPGIIGRQEALERIELSDDVKPDSRPQRSDDDRREWQARTEDPARQYALWSAWHAASSGPLFHRLLPHAANH